MTSAGTGSGPSGVQTTVVALMPALDRADTVGAAVSALLRVPSVDQVVVIDDGSGDATAEVAVAAGARVVRLERNRGKGAALQAGIAAAPDADVYLLVDADVAATAAGAAPLLEALRAGAADLAIGVLPPAAGRGGFGRIRDLAAFGIARATGFQARAPLSGQRAIRGELLRALPAVHRFGLETAMTIDAIRAGGRVVEIDVDMDHRHTGRGPGGFAHRAGQGRDIVRALWPRLTTSGQRLTLTVLAFLVAAAAVLISASAGEVVTVPLGDHPDKVVIFGMPGLGLDDLGTGVVPTVDALVDEGALSAMSVRTLAGRPSTVEGYASLGAGTRVRADDLGGYAFDATERVEGGTAREALQRRTGAVPPGEVVVVGQPDVLRQSARRHLSSQVGALGDALHRAGRTVAVVGNADTGPAPRRRARLQRPAAVALADTSGSVALGRVGPGLLQRDQAAPFGHRADHTVVLSELRRVLGPADVVLVDPGDTDRAAGFAAASTPEQAAAARQQALRRTDALLADTREVIGRQALLLVVSVRPAEGEWHLTPIVAANAGITQGSLHSTSTRRRGVVTLTDVAPTVLAALGVETPEGMIGHPLTLDPRPVTAASLQRLDRDAAYRESIYLSVTVWYIVLQAFLYLLAILVFTRLGGAGRVAAPLRWIVLAVAAHPLGTFVLRAVPGVARLGWGGVALLVAIDVGIAALALRARRHPLSPLQWIMGATIALLVLDVATGARLQLSSILGYSPHTAARFRGFGNTAFAALGATTVLFGAVHVHRAPRRREAAVSVALLFALVVLVDGAPTLGSDVGGILTLVPVFGLTLLALAGRRVSWRAVAAALAVTVVALAGAAVVDYLRPPDARTHLGRLVADVRSGGSSPFTTTVARKVATNFRTFRSPWTWSVVVITAYMLTVLAWARGWSRLLPPRSALRAGAVGTLAAGLLGYATNDSGIVVTALVFVYLGPFLTMVALEQDEPPPHVLEPAPTTSRAWGP